MKDELKLLPQTEVGLLAEIQKYGSNFRCLQAMAEYEAGKALNVNDINELYNSAVNKGYMNSDCVVTNKDKVIE